VPIEPEAGWPDSHSGRFEEQLNLLRLSGVEPRSFGLQGRSRVTVLTELSRLPAFVIPHLVCNAIRIYVGLPRFVEEITAYDKECIFIH